MVDVESSGYVGRLLLVCLGGLVVVSGYELFYGLREVVGMGMLS